MGVSTVTGLVTSLKFWGVLISTIVFIGVAVTSLYVSGYINDDLKDEVDSECCLISNFLVNGSLNTGTYASCLTVKNGVVDTLYENDFNAHSLLVSGGSLGIVFVVGLWMWMIAVTFSVGGTYSNQMRYFGLFLSAFILGVIFIMSILSCVMGFMSTQAAFQLADHNLDCDTLTKGNRDHALGWAGFGALCSIISICLMLFAFMWVFYKFMSKAKGGQESVRFVNQFSDNDDQE